MFVQWTKHLKDEKEVENFERSVWSSKHVLDRLLTLLSEEEANLDRSETDIRIFDLPNWSDRQAFKNGQRATLSYLKKLINLDQQKDR